MHPVFVAHAKAAQPIWFVTPATFSKVVAKLDKRARAYVKAAGFEPRPGRHLILPSNSGTGGVLFGLEGEKGDKNAFLPGLLPGALPEGTYRFANAPRDPRLAALAFALGAYATRYRKTAKQSGQDRAPRARRRRRRRSLPHRRGLTPARDLINTPANDMAGRSRRRPGAGETGAKFRRRRRALLGRIFAHHAVGRAAAPRARA
jgi:leucyl aminopeptidase